MSPIWIELAKAAVDLVRAVVWPFALVFLAVDFEPELRAALSSLLRRKVDFEGLGLKVAVHEPEQQQTAKDAEDVYGVPPLITGPAENPSIERPLIERPSIEKQSLDPSPRPAVTRIENELRDALKTIDPGKEGAVLLRSLAEARLERGHEAVYNRIFGSQIEFLKRLNEVPHLTVDQAREFFKPYADQFPQVYSKYSFDAWLNYMTVNALAARNGDDLEISEIGRDFLVYIINQRLPEKKPW